MRLYNIGRLCASSRNSLARRRDSLGLPASPPMREMEHPSAFPNFLRRDDAPSPARRDSRANRNSIGVFPSAASLANLNARRDSMVSNGGAFPMGGLRDWNRDSTGSVGCLLRKVSGVGRRFSIDSLDSRRNSWDPDRRPSVTWEDYKEAATRTKVKSLVAMRYMRCLTCQSNAFLKFFRCTVSIETNIKVVFRNSKNFLCVIYRTIY